MIGADDVMPSSPPSEERSAIAEHIRGGTLLVAGQGISLSMAFAAQVLMVRYLTKSDFGAFAYALAVVLIAQAFCTFGLNRTIARFASIYHEEGRIDRLFGAIALGLAAIFGVGVVVIAATFAILRLAGDSIVHDATARTVLAILIVLAPVQAVDDLMMSLFAVFGRVRTIFLRTYVVAPALRLAVVLVLIAVHSDVRFLAAGFVASGVFGFGIFALLFVRMLRREELLHELHPRSLSIPIRSVFGLTIPLLVADLTYILLTSTDAVLLGYFRGTTEVAAFRAVQPAAKLNEVVSSSFLILFTPVASRLFARGDRGAIKDLYWKTATWIAVFTFPIFVVTFALARPFTVLVFGDRYSSSGTLLAVLAVGYYLQVAVGFNGTVLMVMGKMKLVVGSGLVAVAANIALDLVLIPRYGAIGAAAGTSSALVIYNVLKQVALRVGAGVPVFDRHYLRVYVTIACGAASVALLEHALQLKLLIALPFALAVSLLVLRLNRRSLAVAETFPELRRLPLGRRIFGE